MSGYLPANTTLQLSDSSGNINHQGILTSNVNGTPLLSTTFPTTSTGTSTCHSHYTSTDNALQLLNASASKSGGHEFWNSSSSEAPKLLLSTNRQNTGSQVPVLVYNNADQRYYTQIEYTQLFLRDNQLNNILTLNNLYLQLSCDTAINKILINNNDTPTIKIDDISNNECILSSNDLKFNNVSLPSTVITNTSNIATNTSSISTLQIKQTNLLNVYNSPAIYADGAAPLTVPTSINNSYAQQGWYFKNTSTGLKINWYIPPSTGLKVQDILGLYLRLFNCNTTSNDTIFLTVYTVADSSSPNYSWYKSKMTYIITNSITANTNYTFFENASTTCPDPSHYASTLLPMSPSPVQNPRGTYAPTETIMFFSIGSNSISTVNTVEVVVQKFGVMTSTGTQEFNFIPLL